MSASRRTLLSAALRTTAAVAVAGAGGVAWRLYDTGMVGSNAEPFDAWASYGDLPMGDPLSLVGAAILAANPHNTQPWRFEVSLTQIDLFAVVDRNLGSFDPYLREMWLGLGCAVENMSQAAGAKGFVVESVEAAPGASSGESDHAARLVVRRGDVIPSRLAAVIASRRTNRSDYLPVQPVDRSVLETLVSLSSGPDTKLMLFRATEEPGAAFANDTVTATAWINADRTMSGDSHRWFRANPRDVARHRDGVSIPTTGFAPWLATMGQILPPTSNQAADGYWLDSTRRQVDSAPWFGMLAVRDLYDRRQQIEAGRLWQRAQLELTAAGLASQPLNQMVEVVDRERQLGQPDSMARHLAAWTGSDWHPTFAFRFGHADRQVPHSARRALSSVVGKPTEAATRTAGLRP